MYQSWMISSFQHDLMNESSPVTISSFVRANSSLALLQASPAVSACAGKKEHAAATERLSIARLFMLLAQLAHVKMHDRRVLTTGSLCFRKNLISGAACV